MTKNTRILKLALLLLLNIHLAENTSYCQDKPPPKTDPVMTEELMGRLIKRTLASKKDVMLDMRIGGILGISDGKADIPVRQVGEKVPEGSHIFTVPVKEGSKDIVIAFRRGEVLDVYLTDRSGVLRAAAISDATGIRLITNEQAADRYQSEMQLFAKLAQDLPPTGTADAGDKK